MMDCECCKWGRPSSKLLTKHHPNCTEYDIEKEVYQIIYDLLNGVVSWAHDEDGVHPDCWEAFKQGALFIGRWDLIDKSS